MNYPTLNKPPLKEAVLEVTLDYRESDIIPLLEKFSESIKGNYPKNQPLINFQAQMKGDLASLPQISKPSPAGFRLSSADDKSFVVVKQNSIAMSAVALSYTSWGNFFPPRYEMLINFLKITQPNKIVRASLRFINEIEIEDNVVDFLSMLKVPPAWKFPLTGSVVQASFEATEQNVVGTVREIVQPSIPGVTLFIDIDVQSVESQIDVDLIKTFENLRNFKNSLFFTMISEGMLQKFR